MKFILMLALLFPAYSWGVTCKQEALGSNTPSVTYKICLAKEKKRRAILLKAMKKYKRVVGYCGTKEDRRALGIRLGPYSGMFNPYVKGGISFTWGFNRIVKGWALYNRRDGYSGDPIPHQYLIAVRLSSMLQNKFKQFKDYGAFSSGAECLGYLQETRNTSWFGFPIRVRFYEAINHVYVLEA